MRTRIAPLLLLVSACSSGPSTPASTPFPKGFLFGTAVAGFQVDMGCPTIPAEECEDTRSDWYQWVTDPRVIADKEKLHFTGDAPSTGPGFYELYAQDFSRAKNELKLGSVRLSIEWSRIFPNPTFEAADAAAVRALASPAGVAYYHRLFAEMKAQGLVPMVTLTHYTLPVWIHDGTTCHFDFANCKARGWLDASTLVEAEKYARFVGEEFGGEVDLWATENEPLAITLAGYLMPGEDRTNPPVLSLRAKEAREVTIAQIRGHARLYDGVKAGDTKDADGDGKASQVGLVFNMAPVAPADPDREEDVNAAKNVFYLYDELFLNGTIKGELDVNADGKPVRDESLVGRMDYLGINYYTQIKVAGLTGSVLPEFSPLLTLDPFSPKTKLWNTYPKGLYEMVMYVKEHYGLPMYITENGATATPKEGDPDQVRFFAEHLQWLKRAIDEGADVRGFYWWSLMDNYEWNHGMSNFFFGLYGVSKDDPTKARTKRPLVDVYARVAAEGKLPDDLVSRYPISQ